ncbi:hypothetical protein GCM10022225_56970 [Plantactinospora mayteni]|uniref:Uncharacterized protein n=1 Tax=Plantactinospora mayteni TaxID=566021 RepID=A0ABQ4EUE4_9ACTN|nr:hypothetical protein [Plantactinospora mayteni]GIG98266.1 hypothetical protein Pma05_48390 [Plantactinospora mayteni]
MWSRPATTSCARPLIPETPRPALRRTRRVSSRHPESRIMQRYVAPLGFTLAAAWVVLVFILVRATP